MHRTEGGSLEVRTFCPVATRAMVRPEGGEPLPMTRVHPEGVFAWSSPPGEPRFGYTLVLETEEGDSWETRDPYVFLPQLGDTDLYLLGEGRHLRLYDRFGGRLWRAGDCEGVLFSLWAPNASGVSVIGSWNGWDRRRHPMRSRGESGVWELFVPGLGRGDLYKYSVMTGDGGTLEKADPLALRSELRPMTASVVEDVCLHRWTDGDWMERRAGLDHSRERISIYEVHPQSWRRPEGGFPTWDLLIDRLVPYVGDAGFTHVELLPVMEHPFDGSWGYQTLGYYAPTVRLGPPEGFQRFVDACHRAGIGVILDWAPAHFPDDPHGLARLDGTALYEHEDPRRGRHPDWGTLVFNYGRNEVRNFLLASALFWAHRYHVDGLRVDAVASMLYLDYSRPPGEWVPNRYGGREDLDAVELLRTVNDVLRDEHPGFITAAEESTAWPGVTAPTSEGGLGFTFKWNMGWMNDSLRFFARDPVHRKHHMRDLTFSLVYAFSERYILPLSHDEVVHGKSSLTGKGAGDQWRKLANLRTLLAYQWTHPGKQLLFMGGELAQWREWDHDGELDWELLAHTTHGGVLRLVTDLNALAEAHPALYELDSDPAGFRWVDFRDEQATVVSYIRRSPAGEELVCILNLTPTPRQGYRVGLPRGGRWVELLNSDSEHYGGSGWGNMGGAEAEAVPFHSLPFSAELTLPPMAALVLGREGG